MNSQKSNRQSIDCSPNYRIGKFRLEALAFRNQFWILLLLIFVLASGCVRRRMIVRSNPEGATVFIDQQEVGHTPVSVPFTYYGTREFTLEREGYQTTKAKQYIRPPWYQIPPLDFFADNLWPFEIHDDRIIDFELTPKSAINEAEFQDRANQFRSGVLNGFVVPMVGSSDSAGAASSTIANASSANGTDNQPPSQTR